MNIHEYQAKALFEKFGIPVPKGVPATTEAEIDAALASFAPGAGIVVKSQIHAGGRGKGTFKDGYKGGVKVCSSVEEAAAAARAMLGNVLVTHQTGPEGRQVNTVYLTEASTIAKEYYLALLMDRETKGPLIIASTEGGVDIEEVSEKMPEKIIKLPVHPLAGLEAHQCRRVAKALELSGSAAKELTKLLKNLYRLFVECDCSLLEVNPLIRDEAGHIVALDAKVNFDENGLFRHPDIAELRDVNEEDPKEVEAGNAGLSYVALDGNIACLVNGAGLAMATMDIIKHHGGNPANFLDVGGGATEEQVTAAFKIILTDPNVRGILVNIFGGIMRCDVIARGIIAAAQSVKIEIPLVVRLEGTNVEQGREALAQSGLAITSAGSLDEAARKIVEMVQTAV
ncbi:MAG: ADP-forming succinate--CoA ligase subunit beta [Opitutales bacterium]